MSMFYCAECDNLRDADDGCEEMGGQLTCADCVEREANNLGCSEISGLINELSAAASPRSTLSRAALLNLCDRAATALQTAATPEVVRPQAHATGQAPGAKNPLNTTHEGREP